MKDLKCYILLFIISGLTTSLSAQSFISSVELFAGPSLLSIRDNTQYKEYGELKIGYSFGVGLVHDLGKKWAVSTQIAFDRKGYKQSADAMFPPDIYNNPPTYNLPPAPTELKGNLNSDYLTISLLPRYSIGNKLKVQVSVGPYYGKLTRSQLIITEIQNDLVKRRTLSNQKDTFKNYDLGISYSIGLTLKEFEKTEMVLNVNYNYGLPNVKEIQPGIEPQKNNSLLMAICFRFK